MARGSSHLQNFRHVTDDCRLNCGWHLDNNRTTAGLPNLKKTKPNWMRNTTQSCNETNVNWTAGKPIKIKF